MDENFKELLGRVFDSHREDLRASLPIESYERLRFDFVFHMTDWLTDLDHLNALRGAPEEWSTDRAEALLIGLLYHVIPHIKAAGRLLLDEVRDGFEGNDADRLLAEANRAGAGAS